MGKSARQRKTELAWILESAVRRVAYAALLALLDGADWLAGSDEPEARS